MMHSQIVLEGLVNVWNLISEAPMQYLCVALSCSVYAACL